MDHLHSKEYPSPSFFGKLFSNGWPNKKLELEGRRLIPRANQLIVLGYAVKTLESKETKASKEITVTHNSVFAAHRLQCRMTIRKIDIRHFVSQNERIRKPGTQEKDWRWGCPQLEARAPSRVLSA